MTQYKCGKFTVTLLHYGNKLVFLRDGSGEEFTVQRDYFDENYSHGNSEHAILTPLGEHLRQAAESISRRPKQLRGPWTLNQD